MALIPTQYISGCLFILLFQPWEMAEPLNHPKQQEEELLCAAPLADPL